MKKNICKHWYLLFFTFLYFSAGYSQEKENTQEKTTDYLTESPASFDQRMEWWRDDRFGMFIHWGAYAVAGGEYNGKKLKGIGEWIMEHGQIPVAEYEKFAKQFNPVKFNADQWVNILKNAGMKYMVITSKHHDGFAMWNSEVSDYNIVDYTPYDKDVLKELSAACKKQGVKFGLYYSIMDWHHPDAQRYSYLKNDPKKRTDNKQHFADYLENYMKPQLKELITNYDPAILWFDGEWINEFTHEQGLELYRYIRSLKPDILINNRVDKGRQGMEGMNKNDRKYAGDFGTPEQEILSTASTLDWESCMTMNDTWGFKKNDHNWKSAKELVHNLIDVTAKGGNYLLNVGPTAEGEIPAPSVERLEQIGNWLKINGQAIYKTEKLKQHYKQGEHIRFTKERGNPVYYAIVLKKPEKNLVIKYLKPNDRTSIRLLGYDKPLRWKYDSEKGTTIQIPKEILKTWNKDSFAWVFRFEGNEL